jgi:hypothetical protein
VKLGIKARDDGTLTLVVAATGEEVEGQRFIVAKSAQDCETRIFVELIAYAPDDTMLPSVSRRRSPRRAIVKPAPDESEAGQQQAAW